MPHQQIDYRDCDREIWEQELADFVPRRLLDAHIHLYWRHCLDGPPPAAESHGEDTDVAALNDWAAVLYPGREMRYLTLGTPYQGTRIECHTRAVLENLASVTGVRHHRLVSPACRLQDIERDLQHPAVTGLKPYRTYSVTGDIAQCRIHEFLTHEQMELANEHECWVTLHLSRFHGCADEDNLRDLREYTTRRYPRIRWILAHCARSFTYWPIARAIEELRDLPNIYYDTSAVTDPRPYITLLQREDPERIFWGSDGVAAAFFHGHYAALGRAWQHYDADRHPMTFPHCDGRPILSVYEQLLSLKFACETVGLSRSHVDGIFHDNAARALGFPSSEPAANA